MSYLNCINDEAGLFAIINQNWLWDVYVGNKSTAFFGGISAMPSLHVAISFLFTLTTFRLNKSIGVVLFLYTLLIQIGSVLLGWHYAVDGYLSIVLTFCIWKSVDYFLLRYNLDLSN
jgi:membrane-associated phospholipid phosphatase